MDSNPRTRDSELHSTVRKQASADEKFRKKVFLAGELIGEEVVVEWSSCKELVGLQGRIVDETLGSFVVETPRGEKRVAKKGCAFLFPASGVRVNGSALLVRPEERTKKMLQAK